jgi:hypothetical protein
VEEYAKIEMIEEDGKVYASKDEENFKKMKEEKFNDGDVVECMLEKDQKESKRV